MLQHKNKLCQTGLGKLEIFQGGKRGENMFYVKSNSSSYLLNTYKREFFKNILVLYIKNYDY